MIFAFYTASAIALLATGLVVTRRNAVHALLYLVVSLLAVAVMLALLGAAFAAALEVIVYAGAIMVLFLFVVMMVEHAATTGPSRPLHQIRIWLGPSILAAVLLAELVVLLTLGLPASPAAEAVGPKAVGVRLLGPYLLAVELASLLLLAGLVGAWHLGRPAERNDSHPRPSAPKQETGP